MVLPEHVRQLAEVPGYLQQLAAERAGHPLQGRVRQEDDLLQLRQEGRYMYLYINLYIHISTYLSIYLST